MLDVIGKRWIVEVYRKEPKTFHTWNKAKDYIESYLDSGAEPTFLDMRTEIKLSNGTMQRETKNGKYFVRPSSDTLTQNQLSLF